MKEEQRNKQKLKLQNFSSNAKKERKQALFNMLWKQNENLVQPPELKFFVCHLSNLTT